MNADLGGVWEPWRPEIGQRVRIRLSAECQAVMHAAAPPPTVSDDELRNLMSRGVDVATMFARDNQETGHPRCLDGVRGEITAVYRDDAALGHYYRVLFDDVVGVNMYIGGDFAAIELEPISSTTASSGRVVKKDLRRPLADLRFIRDRVLAEIKAHPPVGPLLDELVLKPVVKECQRGHRAMIRRADGRRYCVTCKQDGKQRRKATSS